MAISFSIIPYSLVLLSTFILSLVLRLPPSSTVSRLCGLVIILPILILIGYTAKDAGPMPAWNTFIGVTFGSQMILEAVDRVCLKRMHANEHGILACFVSTAKGVLRRRRIGTPYQVPKVPPFRTKDPTYVPSRQEFLFSRLIRFGFSYLLLDLMTSQSMPDAEEQFAAWKEPLLTRLVDGEVTLTEFGHRMGVTIGFWIGMFISQFAFYEFFSILAVGTGISDVTDWPPRNGSLWECYSIRKLWGDFWHQDNRSSLTANAAFIVHDLLHIPKGIFSRYAKIFLTFLLSGIVHIHSDYLMGVPVQIKGPVYFFAIQTVAIVIEDGIETIYQKLNGGQKKLALWQRFLGFIWVVIFLTYSTPFWAYPSMRRNADFALPIRVFGRSSES